MIRKTVLSVLAFLTITSACLAGDYQIPDDEYLVLTKLFETMRIEETVNQLVDTMTQQMRTQMPLFMQQQLDGSDLTESQKEAFLKRHMPEYIDKSMRAVFNLMNVKTMVEKIYIPVYSKYFEIEELEALLAFYESPAGRKFVEMTPKITEETIQIMMTDFMPAIYEEMMRITEEFEKNIRSELDGTANE